jgi:L-arginine---[L-arginyl-carrier protein] ligase
VFDHSSIAPSSLGPDTASVVEEKHLSLNGSQTGIWFGEQTALSASLYTVAHYVELKGDLDVAFLQRAICLGLSEVDTIHARFDETEYGITQSWSWPVHPEQIDVPIHDLREFPDPMQTAVAWMTEDLTCAPAADSGERLYSHQLFLLSDTHWVWYQRFHHLSVDGYSFMALTRRILDIYSAQVEQRTLSISPFETFDETVAEYQHYVVSERFKKDQQFWQRYSAARELAPVSLATTEVKTATMVNLDARKLDFSFSLRQIERELSQIDTRVTSTDLVMVAIYAYLHKMTHQHEIICGMPFMRRMGSAALCAAGPAVNVLPVCLNVDGQQSLLSLADTLQRTLRQVRKHQYYDAEQIIRDAGQAKLASLYNISINLKLFEQPLSIEGISVVNHVLAAGPIDDLEFSLTPVGDTVEVELLAHPERYSKGELDHHVERFTSFLRAALSDITQPIDRLPLLIKQEISAIDAWSVGAAINPIDKLEYISDLLNHSVTSANADSDNADSHNADSDRVADCPALHFNDRSLSQIQLVQLVNQYSRSLIEQGVGHGDIVALALPRGVEAVVALLAILNSGAAYLPLDLAYPTERLAVMCDDAQPCLILTDSNQVAKLPVAVQRICIDEPSWQQTVGKQQGTPLNDSERFCQASREHLAALIYTSGSTGKPKGVMVSHAGLINLLSSHRHGIYAHTEQRIAQQQRRVRALHSASFSFDASWEQLFWLLLGHELWLANEDERRDAQLLTECVITHSIDTLDVPPSLLAQMLECGLMRDNDHQPSQILIGSEAAPPALWQQLRQYPDLNVSNFYGPTEYTVDAVSASVHDAQSPVIGRPIANTQVYVLDPWLNKVPVGVVGELYLAGESLTNGYWQQPAMTASRFVANPFVANPFIATPSVAEHSDTDSDSFTAGARMYRTGDMVRWSEEGQLIFIGRSDCQIKVRGFRIELGEVESAIAQLPGVSSAVVTAQPFGSSHRLLGYCVLQNATDSASHPNVSQNLRALLHEQLPDYMVPADLLILDHWPMTVNGKIDKKALPVITVTANDMGRKAETEEEHVLCQSIAAILNVTNVCADDDFFALGGDSISAMALGNALRREGFQLRAKDIFALRRPEQMASSLQRLSAELATYSDHAFTLPPLPMTRWFSEHFHGEQHFAHAVIVNVPNDVTLSHLEAALMALLRAHPVLRSVYPSDIASSELGSLYIPAMAQLTEIAPDWLADYYGQYDAGFDFAISRLAPQRGIMGQMLLCREDPQQLRLMVVLHHLVVDGVSWRILLPELEQAVTAQYANRKPVIAAEEYPVEQWARTLDAQVDKRRGAELVFWIQQLQESLPILGNRALNSNDQHRHVVHHRILVPRDHSQTLMFSLPAAYRAQVEEILLTVVAKACATIFQQPKIRFALESHGRHVTQDGPDLNRTVGWLTNEYPVLIDFQPYPSAQHGQLPHSAVKVVKQALRQIPDVGLGYSILRYLDSDSSALVAAEQAGRPSVLFNYLGRFTQSQQDWSPQALNGRFSDVFAVAVDENASVLYPLEVNVFVDESEGEPQLVIHWSAIDELISGATISALHQQVIDEISMLADFAQRSPSVAIDTLVASETVTHDEQGQVVHLSEDALDTLIRQYGPQQAILPVSPLQEGLLFHAQLGDQASQYNSITKLDFNGPLDIERLRRALDTVLWRHPQLGAQFDLEVTGQPLQLIPLLTEPHGKAWPWQFISLIGFSDAEQVSTIDGVQHAELYRPFMITSAANKAEQERGSDKLINAVLIERRADRYTLFLTAHHLVVDGWSTPILINDVLTAYHLGQERLPETRVSYPSIMRELAGRDRAICRQVWREALVDAKPTCLFEEGPTNAPVKEAAVTLSAQLASQLTATGQVHGLTLNTLIQGAWAALLSVMSGRDDVIFGTPISGRFSPVDGIEEHIGLFSNTIPVRVQLDPQQSLLTQLSALQQQQIQLMEYDAIGLGEIQRLAGGATLFDTLLVVENYPDQTELLSRSFHNLQVTNVHNRGYTHYPITALVLPGDEIHVLFEYRQQVKDIDTWIARFQLILTHLATNSNTPWASVSLLTPDELALIAHTNDTAIELPKQTLNDRLLSQMAQSHQQLALADVEQALTYGEVNQRVERLARHLIDDGVKLGDIVAVALPRSVDLTIALLAVLRVGAAYLPLDVGYPDERLAYMMDDAAPSILITQPALASRMGQWGRLLLVDSQIIANETLEPQTRTSLVWPPFPAVSPEMGAYLLYTSGSTGKPKGVLVSHEAIVNRILWMQHQYSLDATDVVLQKTPCSFDVSVWEFFWSMMVGARLMMAPPDSHRDPEALVTLIETHQITTLHFVPSMLAAWLNYLEQSGRATACQSLRRVFCSGEALSSELAARYAALLDAPLHNLYGPTEAAVDVTYRPAALVDQASALARTVPIGLPVWNTQLRILDGALRPVPIGVAGELYLCGVQLAAGYLGKPAMTASRFVADPYAHGQRMYRTGDVARWLPTGDVEYLGRTDDQLKIRGQRVELGEIESTLQTLPGVQEAVVHARILGGAAQLAGMDSRQLVGYVVMASQDAPEMTALRQLMSDKLPAHMVPVAIVALPAFPLSANGKLDRKALPDPAAVNQAKGRQPAPGLESEIAALFRRLLDVSDLSIDDDFFALGGHSLLAMRLAAELRKQYNKAIAVSQIMVAPSIAKLAAILRDDASLAAAKQASFSPILHLREGQGQPLVCIHPASGFAWQYSALLRYLPQEHAVIGLQSPRPNGVIARCTDLDEVCDLHLAALKSVQPTGPYALLGYSLGGTIAHGIAVRLQQLGDNVTFLGLLDTYPPEGQDWSGPTEEEAQDEVRREQAQFMAVAQQTTDEYAEQEKQEMFGHIVANYQDAVRLLSQGKTARFRGKAELFVACQTVPNGMDIQETWAPYIGELQEHHFDCSHEDILSPESLQTLGPLLVERLMKSECLDE